MTPLTNDPITKVAFSVYENRGVFALLLGSGISRSADIPTGWEITLDLIRRVAQAEGVKNQTDWAKWYEEKTGKAPDYSALLRELAVSAAERRSVLHSYIEPTPDDREEGRKIPTPAHRAIAELVASGYIRVIITTNFDRLIETALRDRGVEPTVVASVDALSGAEPLTHSACYILKLHGDYKDARILNTTEELSKYPSKYNRLIGQILDDYGLIVSGWSAEWDHALRSALLRAPNRRYPLIWTTRGSISSEAKQIVAQRKGHLIKVTDANEFFQALQQRVETLAATHRQNPESVELLVNNAKRYLAKSEFRIQLDELIAVETEKLLQRLDADDFAAHVSWDVSVFRQRVQEYEAATEPLARVAGVLGRWGNEDALPLMLDVIRTLYAHSEKVGGGLTVWLNLRSYPAVLVFPAYGLGLVRGDKWAMLHGFLTAEVARQYREPRKAVETLFLGAWHGTESDLWKRLDGFERKKTPLSDHLLEVFQEWGRSFVGLSPSFETLFEKFELLASLAYSEQSSKEEAKATLSPQGRDFLWMPIGRSVWHEEVFSKIVRELKSPELSAKLLAAGFAHRDAEFLDLFIANASRMASRARFM